MRTAYARRVAASKNNRALEAAQRLMSERGYVVIGFSPSESASVSIGARFIDFGGEPLGAKHELRVVGESTRAEWNAQYRTLFPDPKLTAKNPTPQKGQRFFRCELVPVQMGGAA